MTGNAWAQTSKTTRVAAAIALMAAGAALSYLVVGPTGDRSADPVPGPSPMTSPGTITGMAPADSVVTLGPEVVNRAGIVVSAAASGQGPATVRLPGVVVPHGYRSVPVTPLVAGRITRVLVELGAAVKRGQALAEVFSPDVADAQREHVAARAMLEAHDRELRRVEALVEIGAASRQELERIHAEHEAQTAAVESARSRLELYGVLRSSEAPSTRGPGGDALLDIPAPLDGIVTERAANVGQNVGPADRLFTVVDLSTVWVVADLYEDDFAAVHVGSPATVTTAAYPGRVQRGRVTYIDPQVSPATRTAAVRVEVPNPGLDLRLGMYATVVVDGPSTAPMVTVPRLAVQNIGARTVVYVAQADEPGRFRERAVVLGQTSGASVEVLSGLQPGDLVVTQGSFFVRAESERRRSSSPASAAVAQAPRDDGVQSAAIVVSSRGFEPSEVVLRPGLPARLTFTRTTDETCATAVVVPSLNLRRELPLNQPVAIEFTPTTGSIPFACGTDMFRGTIVVR